MLWICVHSPVDSELFVVIVEAQLLSQAVDMVHKRIWGNNPLKIEERKLAIYHDMKAYALPVNSADVIYLDGDYNR